MTCGAAPTWRHSSAAGRGSEVGTRGLQVLPPHPGAVGSSIGGAGRTRNRPGCCLDPECPGLKKKKRKYISIPPAKTIPKCNCDYKFGNIFHYIFGTCSIMNHKFKFNRNKTITENLNIVIHEKSNYTKFKENYNVLNNLYYFIRKNL